MASLKNRFRKVSGFFIHYLLSLDHKKGPQKSNKTMTLRPVIIWYQPQPQQPSLLLLLEAHVGRELCEELHFAASMRQKHLVFPKRSGKAWKLFRGQICRILDIEVQSGTLDRIILSVLVYYFSIGLFQTIVCQLLELNAIIGTAVKFNHSCIIGTVIYHFRCARYFWYLLVFEACLILFELLILHFVLPWVLHLSINTDGHDI